MVAGWVSSRKAFTVSKDTKGQPKDRDIGGIVPGEWPVCLWSPSHQEADVITAGERSRVAWGESTDPLSPGPCISIMAFAWREMGSHQGIFEQRSDVIPLSLWQQFSGSHVEGWPRWEQGDQCTKPAGSSISHMQLDSPHGPWDSCWIGCALRKKKTQT